MKRPHSTIFTDGIFVNIYNNFLNLAPPSSGNDTNIEVKLNDTVTMNCDVQSDSDLKSTITWLKTDLELTSKSSENIQIALEGHRLFIKKASLSDIGVYTCLVRNTAGEGRKRFYLNVLDPPKFTKAEYRQNIQVSEGDSLTMSCYVTGTPFPEVSLLLKCTFQSRLCTRLRVKLFYLAYRQSKFCLKGET